MSEFEEKIIFLLGEILMEQKKQTETLSTLGVYNELVELKQDARWLPDIYRVLTNM
jgi:hypothetical protein